ncbi:hypothetical protein CCP3SC5AM1_440001 [Gammaproteobacteria bacterium]
MKHGFHIDDYIHKGILMSTQPVSDRALRGALSLPDINTRASCTIRVKINGGNHLWLKPGAC